MMASDAPREARITKAAAARRMSKPTPYDGRCFAATAYIVIKADSVRQAKDRVETLCAELVIGAPIDASDLWVRRIIVGDVAEVFEND